MVQNLKVIGNMGKLKDKENLPISKEKFMKEIGIMTKLKEGENI